jgi:hypothetical protein
MPSPTAGIAETETAVEPAPPTLEAVPLWVLPPIGTMPLVPVTVAPPLELAIVEPPPVLAIVEPPDAILSIPLDESPQPANVNAIDNTRKLMVSERCENVMSYLFLVKQLNDEMAKERAFDLNAIQNDRIATSTRHEFAFRLAGNDVSCSPAVRRARWVL